MYHTNYYKYEKEGVIRVCGDVTDGEKILEIMDILNAEDGMTLIRIQDEENVGNSVWLHDGDVQENYREEYEKP